MGVAGRHHHRHPLDDPHHRPVHLLVPARGGREDQRLVDLVHATRPSRWRTTTRCCYGSDTNLATYFVNSIVITIPSVIIPITLATLAAYAFAWMKFPGRDLLFVAVFAMQIVPIQVTMIPLLKLYVDPPFGLPQPGRRTLRWFYTIWLSHSIFALPLAIYLLHNFMKEVPGRADRGGPGRRRRPRADLHQDHAAADGTGHRRVRHLPVPLGLERPAGGAGLRWRQPGPLAADGAAGRAVRHPRTTTGSSCPPVRSCR